MIVKFQFVAVSLLAVILVGCGASAARYNNAGNADFEADKYDEAVEDYVAAQREDPDLAEPYYNAGNAFHRKGNFEAAAAQEKQAIRGSEGDLSQNSFYNLGNTFFRVEDWPAAIEAYKEALKLNPDDEEAKYNLELALKQLEQQQQQQQQQGGGSGQPDEEQNEGGGEQDQQEEPNQGQGDEQEDQQGGGGEPEPDESGQSGSDPQDQPSQSGPRGLTPQEAEQLLDALGQDSQTLQERLQQEFFAPGLPPAKDW